MEDWNKVRKSDDEFIKGIYERASQYKEETENEAKPAANHRFRRVVTGIVSTAAACALAVLGIMKLLPHTARQETGQIPESAVYRSVEEDEIQDGVEETVPEEAVVFTVLGEVAQVEENENDIILIITVEEQDNNELSDEIEVVISQQLYKDLLAYEQENGDVKLIGYPVMALVEKYNWLDYYKLSREDNFYFQCSDEEGQIVYQNLDGDVIRE